MSLLSRLFGPSCPPCPPGTARRFSPGVASFGLAGDQGSEPESRYNVPVPIDFGPIADLTGKTADPFLLDLGGSLYQAISIGRDSMVDACLADIDGRVTSIDPGSPLIGAFVGTIPLGHFYEKPANGTFGEATLSLDLWPRVPPVFPGRAPQHSIAVESQVGLSGKRGRWILYDGAANTTDFTTVALVPTYGRARARFGFKTAPLGASIDHEVRLDAVSFGDDFTPDLSAPDYNFASVWPNTETRTTPTVPAGYTMNGLSGEHQIVIDVEGHDAIAIQVRVASGTSAEIAYFWEVKG